MKSKTILTQGECLKEMAEIPDNYVDMVMCDLPYGTTQNKWDSCIDLTQLWSAYKRICKPSAAIVLTAAQPFTSALLISNVKDWRVGWVWDKIAPTGFLNAKKQPLRRTEDVLVFYRQQPTYNPQMTEGKAISRTASKTMKGAHGTGSCYRDGLVSPGKGSTTERYPVNLIQFSNGHSPNSANYHPTQKPVALMEYMIKTYTDEGMTVLDNCMGSGTTGVACMNLGRNFIGIERDPAYFKIASDRIAEAQRGKR
jgi:DNA modification methylase